MTMKYASTFAGVGGFDLGFDRAGMEPTIQVEINKDCQTILNRHWPTVPTAGDIRDVSATDLGIPDLICGGFPCQDISKAAPTRLGLDGARSGLYFEFQRLVDEHLRLVDSARPRWTVLENTDGLLTSNDGRDLAAVVRGLEELGYGWAYRLVDGRHFGTPQRRRRVIVVGHRGGDPRPAWQVLGDEGAGSQAQGTHPVGGTSNGPHSVPGPVGDAGTLIWRKSARPRKKLSEGGYETWVMDGNANTLNGNDGGLANRQTHLLLQEGRLRTLSLREWERLQGFPDDWTVGVSDSARYLQLGNAMNVLMAEWLGNRIMSVDAALPMLQTAV